MIGKKINQLATELAPVSTDLTIIGDPVSGVSKKITLAQLGAIFSGAVSFYTNLASFPVVGDINVIYCAKDTQKLYLWSGSAYTEVFPSQALLDTYQLRSEKGVSNGYASLDSGGKVPISQLPSSIMEYKGTWNAATNTPTLANGTGDTGDVYICNVAGTVNFGAGPLTFAVGDYVIYSGTIWQRSSGAVGTVTSVAVSRSGDALAITGSPITTSGTINIGFAGTGTQYIKGDGTLATFPSIISQAQNLVTEVYNSTGATLTKGTIVYINGGQGNLPTVTKALATGDSTSAQTYGVVQNDITNMNNGYVVAAGRLIDLDTQAYTNGTQLYLSATTAGTWTSTKQYAPNHLVYIGIVVRAHPTQGVVEIKIQNGYEMDELHNVAAQTPSNNDGLFWEASTSLWKNKSIATILGGTPITGSGNVNAIPKFTANSVLGNSVMEDDGNFVSMRGLKLNASAGVGNTINFQQASGITAAGLGYSTIGAAGSTGIQFYLDQNVTERIFIFDTATITSNTARTYSMPDSSGTLALVSQLTGGTVTSVGLSSATSGVTIGSSPITTSGTITLAIATASGSQQGLLSSTDWTTFNNKQSALTNPVTGTGTTNYLPKFTGTSTIGNSVMQEASGNIGIGTSPISPANSYKYLHIEGGNSTSGGVLYLSTSGNTNSSQIYTDTTGLNINTNTSLPIIFNPAGTERMRLNSAGELCVGRTSAYGAGFLVNVQGNIYASAAIVAGSSVTATQFIANGNSTGGFEGLRIVNASTGAAQIVLNNSAQSWVVNTRTDNHFSIYNNTAGTTPFFINTSGNVGIGTTSPGTSKLYVLGDATNYGITSEAPSGYGKLILKQTSGQAWSVGLSSNDLFFYYGGASAGTRVTFANGGNVGIGTTSPGTKLQVVGTIAAQVNADGSDATGIRIYGSGTNKRIDFVAADGNVNERISGIGTGGVGTMTFAVNNDVGSLTERMRITSGGAVLINNTSAVSGRVSAETLQVTNEVYSRGAFAGFFWEDRANTANWGGWYTTSGVTYLYNGSANIASINMSTGAYTALSDINKKKDFEQSNLGLDAVMGLKPTLYRMKTENGTQKHLGFIAQEVKQYIPQAYVQNTDFIGLTEMPIIAALTKAVQELKAELDTLKNK